MSSIKFVLDRAGVKELLKSPEIDAICQEHAQAVLANTGGVQGYVIEHRSYPERNGWVVSANEYPAISDNYQNNTLLKAVGK